MQRIAVVMLIFLCSGCSTAIVSRNSRITANNIPAAKLPEELNSRRRDHLVPLHFSLLSQPRPQAHRIGPNDVLGVDIEKVLENTSLADNRLLPNVHFRSLPNEIQQPGITQNPSIGHPVRVDNDGTVLLPYVEPIPVSGLTIPEAVEAVRDVYIEKGYLKADKNQISINLIRPRTVNVFVLREDADIATVSLLRRDTQVLAKRGNAFSLDLPIYRNDVMHALTESGGLPGSDAYNDLWILRASSGDRNAQSQIVEWIDEGKSASEIEQLSTFGCQVVRIPLRVDRGVPLPFQPSDVILNDGDVVYISTRETEYFNVGGLLQGGSYPMPRDRDIDIFDAIAIANGNVGGPAGTNAAGNNFRSGPGNIVPPSRVIVVRKLPTGEQIKIRVDLKAAMNDPQERLIIQPRDLVVLKYKPGELLTNVALNFVNVGFNIPNN